MIGWLLKKPPLAAGLSSREGADKAQPHRSLWGRSRRATAEAGPRHDCALWHDITRALDAKPKGPSK